MKGGEKVPELEELYSDIKDKLYSYVMKLSGNSHIAEEIVQETFCRALEQILLDKRELNNAWFYTVARHLYFNYIKRQNKYKYTENLDIEDEDSANNLSKNLIKFDETAAIKKVLYQLKDSYREILELREFKELSYDEIAKTMGLNLVQVKVTLYRARSKFKELYKTQFKQ